MNHFILTDEILNAPTAAEEQSLTHPLTDEICELIADTEDRLFTSVEKDNMRAATDWQLEQVIKWIKATESTVKLCPSILAVQLEQAMRPQEDWFEAGSPGSFRREDDQ